MKTHKCGNCGEANSHYVRNCPYQWGICHFCKKGVHKKENCPYYLWHVFKNTYPEVDKCWKITLNLCKKKIKKRWDTEYENLYFSNWPDLIDIDPCLKKLGKEIKKQKYKFADLNFIVSTINFYQNIISIQDTNIGTWIEFLNRIYFIRKCLKNESNNSIII